MHRLKIVEQKLMVPLLIMQILLILQFLIYNLIKYSDNYSDTSGSLWNFKRDEIINNADVTKDNNAPSFKYKANLIGNKICRK